MNSKLRVVVGVFSGNPRFQLYVIRGFSGNVKIFSGDMKVFSGK